MGKNSRKVARSPRSMVAAPMNLWHEMDNTNAITSFRGEYAFLSSFHPARIVLNAWHVAIGTDEVLNRWDFIGIDAPTLEHAYQAYKASDIGWAKVILRAKTPGEAKRLGRGVKLRSGWDVVKETVMLRLERAKFSQHEDLRQKLRDTGDRMLIEGNGWGDRYWGVCNGRGKNRKGVILMQVRQEIAESPRLP